MPLAVVATSRKAHERRVPLHPEQLQRLPAALRRELVFETGYGEAFGWSDARLGELGGGLASRAKLMGLEAVLLLKPLAEDLLELSPGALLWGWPHCVQQRAIAQAAIDRRLSLLAFEAMYAWGPAGQQGLHVFYQNNEIAGYAAVHHALALTGGDGRYGRRRKAVVLGYGAVCHGALEALRARGFGDIEVCLIGPAHLQKEKQGGLRFYQTRRGADGRLIASDEDGRQRPLLDVLARADLILNGILQDPSDPLMFVTADEVQALRPACLILDVSCDEGMGFAFARPTSFAEPMFGVGEIQYYGVDHTPAYLWDSASWCISEALLPYLPAVLAGKWAEDETLRRALEIEQGVIRNPKILDFQGRRPDYPHLPLA